MQNYMEKDTQKYVTTRQNHLEYKRFQDAFLIDIIGYGAYEDMKSSLFSEFLFSKITIYKLPVSQIIWGFFLCMASFASLQSFVSTWSVLAFLFFFILGAGLVFAGYKSFRRIAVYKKTLRYLESKDSLASEREGLEANIQNDAKELWIDASVLWDIKKYVASILEWYRMISNSHEYIQNHRWYFGKISQEWEDMVNREFQWIINYSQEFTLLVQSWNSHHAAELAELEKQIESQELSTENDGWKVALGLQRMSLQEHLKELEKVRV